MPEDVKRKKPEGNADILNKIMRLGVCIMYYVLCVMCASFLCLDEEAERRREEEGRGKGGEEGELCLYYVLFFVVFVCCSTRVTHNAVPSVK